MGSVERALSFWVYFGFWVFGISFAGLRSRPLIIILIIINSFTESTGVAPLGRVISLPHV